MAGLMVTLVLEAGPESGRSFKVAGARAVIGRRKGEVLIKDAEISGSHAEINVLGDKVAIKDLGSTNGTFVNGKKLPSAELRDGDRLTIGQSKILIKIEGSVPNMKATHRAEPPPSALRNDAKGIGPGRNDNIKSDGRRPSPPMDGNRGRGAPAEPPAVRSPGKPSGQGPAGRGPAQPRRSGGGGGGGGGGGIDGIGALISEELQGFSEATDSAIMDLARSDEEMKLPYRTNLYLEVIEGPDQGTKVQFPKGNMVIGRLNADVVLKDSDISRRHALIEAYTKDKIFIKDLASTNGTFVNGQKVTYDKLKHGDKIRVGKSVLRFLVEDVR